MPTPPQIAPLSIPTPTTMTITPIIRQQQLQHILPAQLGPIHGLIDRDARHVQQRIQRQREPVLHIVAETGELPAAGGIAVRVAVGVLARSGADAAAVQVVGGGVGVLGGGAQAEGGRGHDGEGVGVVRAEEVVVVVVGDGEACCLRLAVGVVGVPGVGEGTGPGACAGLLLVDGVGLAVLAILAVLVIGEDGCSELAFARAAG